MDSHLTNINNNIQFSPIIETDAANPFNETTPENLIQPDLINPSTPLK